MKMNRYHTMIMILVSVLLLTSCTNTQTTVNDGSSSDLLIVTSFYPMYVFTMNIVGETEGVSIVNMTSPQTGCLHDYSLRPSDLKILEEADVFVINGGGMESFLEKVLKQYPDLVVIEATKDIPLLKDDHGEFNPHVWVSVNGAIDEVKQITKQLIDAEPVQSKEFQKNSDIYVKSLEELSETMHKNLMPFSGMPIVTFHEAFPYFAQEFNLEIAAVIEREPGSEPGAGELADTINIIRDKGVKALFAEPQYAPKAAEAIANETGSVVYSLDPFVTGSVDDPIDRYQTIMLQNMNTLMKALQ